MSFLGVVARVSRPVRPVRSVQSNFVNMGYAEARSALLHIKETVKAKVSFINEQFDGYRFWEVKCSEAKRILNAAEQAYQEYGNIININSGNITNAAEVLSGHVQKLDGLVKRLDRESGRFEIMAEREFRTACGPLKKEIVKTRPIVLELKKGFPGYRFWKLVDDELEAAGWLIEQGGAKKGAVVAARDKIQEIRLKREEMVAAASKIKEVNRILEELHSFFYPWDVKDESVKIRFFAKFSAIREQIMGYHYKDAIRQVLDGTFKEKLRNQNRKRKQNDLPPKVVKALALMGEFLGNIQDRIISSDALKHARREANKRYHTDITHSKDHTPIAEINNACDVLEAHLYLFANP